MAEVELYIYNGTEKGPAITLTKSGEYEKTQSSVKKSSSKKDDVTTQTETTTTVSHKVSLTLTKLSYKKIVYNPCKVHASLQVGTVQTKTTVVTKTITIDKDRKESAPDTNTVDSGWSAVTLPGNTIADYIKGAKVYLKINGHTVAENYLVFKVLTRFKTVSNSTSLFLELTIFSADKLMDLDKYSRAYTSKKLYSDILTTESEQFKMPDAASTKLSSLIENHMQLMKYKMVQHEIDSDNEKCSWTERDELLIPYIVQYNETFYQFLARSANRFGEFLYFEDGKLNLGMQVSKLFSTDWADAESGIQSLYYESNLSEGIAVKDRAYNYMEHTPENEDAYGESADHRFNFDPVSNDEWTNQRLKAHKFLPYGEVIGEEMKAFIVESVFKVLEGSAVNEIIIDFVKELTMKVYGAINNNMDYNRAMDKAHFRPIKNNKELTSDSSFTQFATYNGSDNLMNNLSTLFNQAGISNFTELFYSLVRSKEKEVGEKNVWLDFGSTYQPINLGDALVVDGQKHVAILVEGSYESNKEHLLVSAIPVYDLKTTGVPKRPDTTVDSWVSYVPFPPALPDVMIRDARPQVAFVADTLDPQNLGRIRVRYPWQDEDGDASPWIRVTLPLATEGGAVNFTPCVGDEVMVGYEHGNIDRPYGMGYLAAPFVNERFKNALPLDQYGGVHGLKMKTGHHLLFTDGFALAPMLFNTLGPLSCIKSLWPVGLTGPWPFGNEKTADFGGGFELSDRYGFYKISGSTDERSVTIESPAGTVEVNAFQGITISAPNGNIDIKGKNVSIEASNQLSLTSGKNLSDLFYYKKEWEQAQNDRAKAKVIGVDFLSGAKETVLSGLKESFLDFSFLRCVVEVLLRPVDGTLQIKSYSFVRIEAGDGVTEMPKDNFRKDNAWYGKNDTELDQLPKVYLTAQMVKFNVEALVDEIRPLYEKVCEATASFNAISGDNGINKNGVAITYEQIVKHGDQAFDEDAELFKWEDAGLKNEPLIAQEAKKQNDFQKENGDPDEEAFQLWQNNRDKINSRIEVYNAEQKKKRDTIIEVANKLRNAAHVLSVAANKWNGLIENNVKLNSGVHGTQVDKAKISEMIKKLSDKEFKGIKKLTEMADATYNKEITMPGNGAWKAMKKCAARYVTYEYINDNNIVNNDYKIVLFPDFSDNGIWKDFVKSIEPDSEKPDGTFKGIMYSFGKKIHLKEIWENTKKWKSDYKGKILFSEDSDTTYQFDGDNEMKHYSNREFHAQNIQSIRNLLKKM